MVVSQFQNFQSIFSQPLVCLLSPNTLPPAYDCDRRKGNLFTLFLHSPLMGLLQICRFSNISLKTWERASSLIDSFMGECCRILLRARQLGNFFSFPISLRLDLIIIIIVHDKAKKFTIFYHGEYLNKRIGR